MNSGSGESSRLGPHQNNNGESGILRNRGPFHHHHHHRDGIGADNFADLLVFGYSCKVFRDDDKARFIDQGRHLIPWMGDNQLKIDRYDARGALHDLSQHEPPPGGYGNRIDCLSQAEQRAEQLCEEERYHSLYTNEVEEEIAQEEAAKRAAAAGAEIAFNYDDPPAAGDDGGTDSPTVGPKPPEDGEGEDSSDPPFVAPNNFEIPHDLERPETMKEHAIIEKTAKFIASQDSQMEILLKAKQAANPQFDFLNPGGHLYRYYRHVLMAVKTNQYPEDVPEEESNGLEVDSAESIAEVVPEKPKLVIPAIKYKPSVDCAYTQLISKITGAPIPSKSDDEEEEPELLSSQIPLTFLKTKPNNQQEEKPVETKSVPTGLAGLVQYNSDSEDSGNETQEAPKQVAESSPKIERRKITFSGAVPPEIFQHVIEKTATYVVKNGYSFEEALRTKNDPRFLFLRKDHEFYPYYAFRVRYLTDPFEEVRESPEKVTITREIENGTVVEMPSIGIKTVNITPQPVPAPQPLIQATKPGGAVCFSIKNKDEGAKSISSSVVQELGGGDEEETGAEQNDNMASTEAEPLKESKQETAFEEEVKSEPCKPPSPVPPPVVLENNASKGLKIPLDEIKLQLPLDILESSGSKDQKRLEDRIKDKIAGAARDKMALIAKEKQLQLERKKKASMFLSLINKGEPSKTDDRESPTEVEQTQPQTPSPEPIEASSSTTGAKNGFEASQSIEKDLDVPEDDGDSSSEMSVHSIPSHSASPGSNRLQSSTEDDVVLVEENVERPSRSRTRSPSQTESSSRKRKHKHKSKSSSSKKSKKKRSKSVSRSRSQSRSKAAKSKRKRTRTSRSRSKSSDRSRSRSQSERDAAKKHKKKKSKKKSHKHRKSSPSSSSSRQHRHHNHHKQHHNWEERRESAPEGGIDYLSEERWKMLQYDL